MKPRTPFLAALVLAAILIVPGAVRAAPPPVDPMVAFRQSLQALDLAMAAMAQAKPSKAKDDALRELSVARVQMTEGLRALEIMTRSMMVPYGQENPGQPTIVVNVVNPEPVPAPAPVPVVHEPLPRAQGPMSHEELQNLLSQLKDTAFADAQLGLVRDAARRNRFETNQVVKIMKLFTFGKDQVEAGAILYPKVIDKKNFFNVYQVFTFDSDKAALRQKVDAIDNVGLPPQHQRHDRREGDYDRDTSAED
jgi:hypothetical protein